MKKKVLFLGPFPPPHYGSSILCEEIYNFLKKSDRVFVRRIRLNYSKGMEDVGKITLEKIKGIFKVKKQILQEIYTFNPDFVYFAPATKGLGLVRDSYFAQIIKKRKMPILFHMHSRVTPSIRKRGINEWLLKRMLSREKTIVLGNELIDDVNWIIPKEDIFVITNAMRNTITEKVFQKIIKDRRKTPRQRILFLSNMIKSKGWPTLLKAATLLKEEGYSFQIDFVGAWPSNKEKEAFFSYVEDHDLTSYVSYKGQKTGKEKRKIFERTTLFVFPTEYELETFGLVITEAMMYGLPVIANGVATIPSIIEHNKTGFVLQENSEEEVAKYIKILLENNKKQVRMGILARKRFLKSFEMKKYEKRIIDALCTII